MTKTKDIRIADYSYDLPDERIAKFPLAERDQSKLLIYHHGEVTHDVFASLPSHLPQGALMVFNNTRVIQARLRFQKETGAQIEVFCMEPLAPKEYQQNFAQQGSVEWLCMVGNLKRWKEGALSTKYKVQSTTEGGAEQELILTAERLPYDTPNSDGTKHRIRFSWNLPSLTFSEVLEAAGELPIPPYLNRRTEESDLRTYQTVYSKVKGSVAAPTAGLHFTERVLRDLDAAGIDREEVTLHVGAGTFKPVKSEEIGDHEMHSEYIVVRRQTLEKLLAHSCEAIAVGTTSVRTLESLYYIGRKLERTLDLEEDELAVEQWEPYEAPLQLPPAGGESLTKKYIENILAYLDAHHLDALHTSTRIIIAPGYDYKIVRLMVTNFHQPQSTLLLLVSAFVHGDWRKIYDYALGHDFRFLSYGDSSLLIP